MALTIRLAAVIWLLALCMVQHPAAQQRGEVVRPPHARTTFQTSHECVACHNGLMTRSGEDVSIGVAWRASMMANSSRDPYWQASVRRETIDHPAAAKEIENECAICHMPMPSAAARAAKRDLDVFALLPGRGDSEEHRLSADGVSCTLCHQISAEKLGTPESFVGGFVLFPTAVNGERRMLGPFEIDRGRATIMQSFTGLIPADANHLRRSEVCATCHTLFTSALGPNGQVVGRLPEQVPYLEWEHSAFRTERTCQSCHMPVVNEPTRIASVLGEMREGMGRHTFIGGNFFMLRMLNRYRDQLAVEATSQELDASARATLRQLEQDTAAVTITRAARIGMRLDVDVDVRNLTGHKLPTGYPSRRAWLHIVVRDANGRALFESGATGADGRIAGNDNDADPTRYEPHYDTITTAGEVQIYESIMTDTTGGITTGLLQATAFVKDNRLLPRGFDKSSAGADIAVRGPAGEDDDFSAEGDRVSYAIDLGSAAGPVTVDVELRYQPVSYRWAQNLRRYDAPEPQRFVTFYESMADSSSTVLARVTRQVP